MVYDGFVRRKEAVAMADTGFDTLETSQELKAAGVNDAQAKAHAKAIAKVARADLASKADLKAEILGLEVRFHRSLIVLGFYIFTLAGLAIATVELLLTQTPDSTIREISSLFETYDVYMRDHDH